LLASRVSKSLLQTDENRCKTSARAGAPNPANAVTQTRLPVSFFEIRLNADGKGEGKMAVATKLSVDRNKNLMMLEDYAAEPVRLLNIRVDKTWSLVAFDKRE
jgi:hypothetical protein